MSALSVISFLALTLGSSPYADIKTVAKPGETSSGISQRLERQNLVESVQISEEETVELTVPSGLPTGLPQTETDADSADKNQLGETHLLVLVYAAKYGVSAPILEQIISCESRFDSEATGSLGERGLAQFLASTWKTTPQARFGWDAAYHPAVNIEAAAWMLSQGRIQEWTCAKFVLE